MHLATSAAVLRKDLSYIYIYIYIFSITLSLNKRKVLLETILEKATLPNMLFPKFCKKNNDFRGAFAIIQNALYAILQGNSFPVSLFNISTHLTQAPPSQLCEYVKNSIQISTICSDLLHVIFAQFNSVIYLDIIITIVKCNVLLYFFLILFICLFIWLFLSLFFLFVYLFIFLRFKDHR